jgi:hypothetical protein
MKNVQYFSLVTMALIFASLACGFVEVGVETPTTGDEFNNAVDTQEPTSDEVKTTEEIIQPTDETDDEKDDSTLTVAYLAYVGPDNNLWVLEADSQTPRQITFDANRTEGDGAEVEYLGPILSSDGTLLAYYMDVGTPSANGYEYTHGLWVANLITGEQRKIMDGRFAGLAWKPGTHLLAYGHEVDTDYSNPRGEWDTDQAMGIHAIDLDSGEIHYLVAPERGYALASPNWSPDGRFLAFSESVSMETGMFAYYDLENQEYVAWVGGTRKLVPGWQSADLRPHILRCHWRRAPVSTPAPGGRAAAGTRLRRACFRLPTGIFSYRGSNRISC